MVKSAAPLSSQDYRNQSSLHLIVKVIQIRAKAKELIADQEDPVPVLETELNQLKMKMLEKEKENAEQLAKID